MISRRLFIAAGTATTAATATGIYWLSAGGQFGNDENTVPDLIIETGLGEAFDRTLSSLTSSEEIAIAWLETLEREPTKEALLKPFSAYVNLDSESLERRLMQSIQEDFLQGRICDIDGWRLSLVECQLAALRYISIQTDPRNQQALAQDQDKAADGYKEGEIAPLKNWGNQSTLEGQKFNVQPDGHSGLWFQFENAPAHVKITIDGEVTPTVVSDKVVTSGLHDELQERILSTPGQYEIALIDPLKKIRQPIGIFEVKADPRGAFLRGERDSVFCKVTKWGPQKTQAGVAANEQPDGSMGIWIHTDCFPKGAQLLFVDDILQVTPHDFGLTTKIPLPLLGTPGEHPLYFYDEKTKQKQLIGHITVQ